MFGPQQSSSLSFLGAALAGATTIGNQQRALASQQPLGGLGSWPRWVKDESTRIEPPKRFIDKLRTEIDDWISLKN